jgi:hypothetical protein
VVTGVFGHSVERGKSPFPLAPLLRVSAIHFIANSEIIDTRLQERRMRLRLRVRVGELYNLVGAPEKPESNGLTCRFLYFTCGNFTRIDIYYNYSVKIDSSLTSVCLLELISALGM